MKFTVSSADLLKALTTAGGAVPSKSTLPILESVLFERDGDHLRLTATDLEIWMVQRLPVTFDDRDAGDNRVAIPVKRLLDTLRALPDVPVRLTADGEFNVSLQTDKGLYKMVGHDGADYPATPELTGDRTFEADGSLLRRAIHLTSFAVSRDSLRPAMMGIYFQVDENEGRAVATDGHRLVKLQMGQLRSRQPLRFIVPEKALTLASRVASDDPCTVEVDNAHVSFDFGASRVLARMIDETYPNYEAVIPVDNDRRMVVGRDAMLAAAKRVGLYSSSMTNQIRLNIQATQVEISAEDIERSSEAREVVNCEYRGEDMVIGFNSVYLNEVLSHIESEEVVFEFSSPNRAGVVTPQEQREDEDLLMLIMPVMLNTYA
ncbi:MAG TPA: DNA polymerase III subunit beta [Rhodothermales bacterium]